MRDDSYMLISAMRGFQIYVHVQHFLQGCKVKVEVFKTEKKGWESRTLKKIWNCKCIFFTVIFRKEMPYWYSILQVSNFVFSPSFFFWINHRAEYSKNKNNPQYFCHSIKNCNCSPGISLVWSTVEKS